MLVSDPSEYYKKKGTSICSCNSCAHICVSCVLCVLGSKTSIACICYNMYCVCVCRNSDCHGDDDEWNARARPTYIHILTIDAQPSCFFPPFGTNIYKCSGDRPRRHCVVVAHSVPYIVHIGGTLLIIHACGDEHVARSTVRRKPLP